ncbi:MAG: hypothetical protein KDB07_11190, partial [Planctomycetes bacterium]|nr:hypothetical protein [Planctomycetota bacterium]
MTTHKCIKALRIATAALMCSAALSFAACGGGSSPIGFPTNPGTGGGGGGGGGTQPLDATIDFSLAAGMTEIMPVEGTVSPAVDFGRFGINGFDRVYEVTTPAAKDFAFQLVARNPGNSGDTRISVGHGAIAGSNPIGGIETIAGEGMLVTGPGIGANGDWVEVNGDGFARISVSGTVDRDQVLIAKIPQPEGDDEVVGIVVTIGNESEINQEDVVANPSMTLFDEVIFSSDSYQFGLPAIGVNGDRYSIATYDGNSTDPWAWERKRRWLQYDSGTMATTTGEATTADRDFGNWRNQEVAGLHNVLAMVTTGHGGVNID